MFKLKTVLRMNAISCVAFGAIFTFFPSQVAAFLAPGNPAPEAVLLFLGVVLLINGAHLIWASTLVKPSRWAIFYFSIGDFAWVVGTFVLVVSGIWITSTDAIFAATVVAVLVGYFGFSQIKLSKMLMRKR